MTAAPHDRNIFAAVVLPLPICPVNPISICRINDEIGTMASVEAGYRPLLHSCFVPAQHAGKIHAQEYVVILQADANH